MEDKNKTAPEVPVQEQLRYTDSMPFDVSDKIELQILELLSNNKISSGLSKTILHNCIDNIDRNSFIII